MTEFEIFEFFQKKTYFLNFKILFQNCEVTAYVYFFQNFKQQNNKQK